MKQMPIFHNIIATGFGAGYFPYGPGTMGAILAVAIYIGLSFTLSYSSLFIVLLALIVVFTVLGVWSGTISEKYWGEDPSRVVVDEMVGQWIVMTAIPQSLGWKYMLASLILFRFFDIVKPLGVRKMEQLGGGLGIMADDILAGIYGAIVLFTACYFGF